MLHLETIEPATLELLKQLQSLPELSEMRLVGGTSLALQLGHRISVDLDLFGRLNCGTDVLLSRLSKLGATTLIHETQNIHIFIINGVKVDIVNFELPWRSPAVIEDGIRLAHLEDIAAMKITAAVGRGTKKDFIDICYLLQSTFTMSEMLTYYLEKYPNASKFMAFKSLSYFEDAENDVMPRMLIDLSWDDVKSTILKALEQQAEI